MNCKEVVFIPAMPDGSINMDASLSSIKQALYKISNVFVYDITFMRLANRMYMFEINYRDDEAEIKLGGLK